LGLQQQITLVQPTKNTEHQPAISW